MKRICVVIAPTNRCNLKCDYCYNRCTDAHQHIDISTVEYFVDMLFQENDHVDFVWRGGEPLLAGRAFYRKVRALQLRASIKYGAKFHNGIQTNGTLLDKRWIRFLKRYRFDIGISYDGYNNDIHREHGEETVNAIKLCNKMGKAVGCISVITESNLDLVRLYDEMKLLTSSIKFNPCFIESDTGYAVTSNLYSKQLISLFEHWILDTTGKVNIGPLIDYVRGSLGITYGKECVHDGCLGKILDIDSKGIVRICAHEQDDSFVLGDIRKFSNTNEIFSSNNYLSILKKMIDKREQCIHHCELYSFCQGGCCVDTYRNSTFSCEVIRTVFPYISKRIYDILSNNEDLSKYNMALTSIVKEAICVNPTYFSEF